MYDASVDVYSFGVMLNELFSGQKPYSDRSFATQFQLMYKVMSEGVRPTLVSPLRCPPQVCVCVYVRAHVHLHVPIC